MTDSSIPCARCCRSCPCWNVGRTLRGVVMALVADTDRVFGAFLRLCEAAGPDRCALAGHGSVVTRVDRLLAELRRNPIPVPSGELIYGEALTALKYSGLPDPAIWSEVAAVLELTIEGDASVLDGVAAGATTDQARILLQEQGVALVGADSPAHHPAAAWPAVVRRLEAVSDLPFDPDFGQPGP